MKKIAWSSLILGFTLAVGCTPSDPGQGGGGSGGSEGSGTGGASSGSGGASTGSGGSGSGGDGSGGVTSSGGNGSGGSASGGSGSGSGGNGSGGVTSSGGNGSGGSASGGAPATGSGGAGGGATAGGGRGAGGRGGAATSSGGVAGGGRSGGGGGSAAAGSSGSGSGGSTVGATPSAGCGKMTGKPTSTNVPSTIITFPNGYDGSTPIPLVFGFHGAGRTNANFQTADAHMTGSDLEKNYVMAYVKSMGTDWTSMLSANETLFTTVYNQITQTYCIDTSRVFATGHSSGAQFIVNLLCAATPEKRLAAVAPVAASKYCNKYPALPVLYIQGAMDSVRNSNGKDVVDVFVSSNMCMATSTPDTVPTCKSYLDSSTTVTPGCVQYSGCSEPTIWCSHNDPNYNGGTNHGWPCFATSLMYSFFSAR
jgi:polyhydroxybutyrate depolymerase